MTDVEKKNEREKSCSLKEKERIFFKFYRQCPSSMISVTDSKVLAFDDTFLQYSSFHM